jgi:hypothetical protein
MCGVTSEVIMSHWRGRHLLSCEHLYAVSIGTRNLHMLQLSRSIANESFGTGNGEASVVEITTEPARSYPSLERVEPVRTLQVIFDLACQSAYMTLLAWMKRVMCKALQAKCHATSPRHKCLSAPVTVVAHAAVMCDLCALSP